LGVWVAGVLATFSQLKVDRNRNKWQTLRQKYTTRKYTHTHMCRGKVEKRTAGVLGRGVTQRKK